MDSVLHCEWKTVTYKWARDECMEIDKMLLENNELSDDSEVNCLTTVVNACDIPNQEQ